MYKILTMALSIFASKTSDAKIQHKNYPRLGTDIHQADTETCRAIANADDEANTTCHLVFGNPSNGNKHNFDLYYNMTAGYFMLKHIMTQPLLLNYYSSIIQYNNVLLGTVNPPNVTSKATGSSGTLNMNTTDYYYCLTDKPVMLTTPSCKELVSSKGNNIPCDYTGLNIQDFTIFPPTIPFNTTFSLFSMNCYLQYLTRNSVEFADKRLKEDDKCQPRTWDYTKIFCDADRLIINLDIPQHHGSPNIDIMEKMITYN